MILRPATPALLAVALGGLVGGAGCDAGRAGDSADTGVDTAADTGTVDVCADAEAITWDHYGGQILIHDCNGCHAATVTGDARHDAPDEVHFDDADEAWTWAKRILAVATGDSPTMPPSGGVSDDDRVRLEWWFRCGERGE